MSRLRNLLPGPWKPASSALSRGAALVFAPTLATGSAVLGLMVVVSVLPVLQPVLLKQVIERSIALGSQSGAVLALAAGYALTLILPAALEPARRAMQASLEDRAVGAIDRHVIEAGTRLPDLTSIERPGFQDKMLRARSAAHQVPRFVMAIDGAVGQSLTLVGLLVVLGRLQPLIPAALLVTVAPLLTAQRRMNRLQFEAMAARSGAAREADYCVRLTTQPDGAKEARSFGLGEWFLARFEARFSEAYGEVSRLRIRHLWSSLFFCLPHGAAIAGGFWYVAAEASAGQLGAGDIALYINAVIQFEAALFLFAITAGQAHEISLSFGQLFDFVDSASPGIEISTCGSAREAPSRLRLGIEFDSATFRYPEAGQATLVDISAAMRAGTVTALVGVNGSGKSTLVKLLTRMYDPTAGEIRADDARLAVYDLESLRAQIGIVYQDFAKFSLTAGENIRIGAIGADGLDERIQTAALKAGADRVIGSLPEGYDTRLTRLFGGVELSGGEWQRVATARGFLPDAALVILDEPTAALDADAELRLIEELRQHVAGRTALLISHRFSTVRNADQILVVAGGQVLEAGSHKELIEQAGEYARLFAMQAKRYQ